MRPSQSLNGIVARFDGLDEIIEKEKSDVIFSQGDTSTAMAAAIGFHRGVRIVYLEAGLHTSGILPPSLKMQTVA